MIRECNTYKAICMSSVTFKLYNRTVENRLLNIVGNRYSDKRKYFTKKGYKRDKNRNSRGNIPDSCGLKEACDSLEMDRIWSAIEQLYKPSHIIQTIKATVEH